MRSLKVLFTGVIAVGLLVNFQIAAEEKTAPPSDMMKKLEFSKNILDGLVNEDFDKILKSAESLNQLGKRKWLENESAEYRAQNQVFWFTAGTLVLAAQEKNVDGAALSYTQMTVSCVNCHKLIRSR